MDKSLSELISISRKVGVDPTLVQGSSGNTSVKSDDGKYMYIKASGVALKDMDEQKGWRRLRLDMVCPIINDAILAKWEIAKREKEVLNRLLLACDDGIENGRPSIEAHFHAMMDKYVIHLHPDAVAAYINAKNGKAEVEKLFKAEKYPPLWVPYGSPGFISASNIAKAMKSYDAQYGRKPSIVFLEKHGLIVTAQKSDAAMRLVRKVLDVCGSKLVALKRVKTKEPQFDDVLAAKRVLRKVYFDVTGKFAPVQFFADDVIWSFAANKDAKKLLSAAPLCPDELAYANVPAIWAEDLNEKAIAAKVKDDYAKAAKPCIPFLVKDMGLFVIGKGKNADNVRDVARSSFFIRANAARLGGIAALDKRQIDFVNSWESQVLTSSASCNKWTKPLLDRIAIVTGSGSGLGRSIAVGLARAGAMVALADIDVNAASETAEIIAKELPFNSTLVVGCNVTSEVDVDKAYRQLLEKWGALDILVNAAGVAPAYSLIDLPVDKWRFTLEVNLTGYFLMARGAARIMISQQTGGSIINISSKSGIEASKNNTPYNATKAGELHMARGWAMELGGHNIRVNSVCPGNVFEGSKIWNPEYIKVCAKKYGIKPEEVIPYYVNKTMLRREIKGQDIADSVVFLCSDQAQRITAQTIVTDAGQAMVR